MPGTLPRWRPAYAPFSRGRAELSAEISGGSLAAPFRAGGIPKTANRRGHDAGGPIDPLSFVLRSLGANIRILAGPDGRRKLSDIVRRSGRRPVNFSSEGTRRHEL